MKTIDEIFSLPNCKDCNNTRKVIYKDKMELIKPKTADCKCTEYYKHLALLKKSRIPKTYLGFEFSDYKPKTGKTDGNIEINKKSIKSLKYYANCKGDYFFDEGIDLLIYGQKNCGKTLLAIVFLKEMILQYGRSGMYITAEELIIKAIDKTNFKKDEDDSDISFDDLINVDFLLVDNMQKITDVKSIPGMANVVIDDIIKRRKNNNKCMILTSTTEFNKSVMSGKTMPELYHTCKDLQFSGSYNEKRTTKLDGLEKEVKK